MFNLQGSELIIILLLALVVLGPEKLPDAMRKLGQFYAEIRKMSSGFQQEFRSVMDEPVKEMRDTANLLRDSADFTKLQDGERDEKPKSAEMATDGDPEPVPTDEVPFRDAGDDDDVDDAGDDDDVDDAGDDDDGDDAGDDDDGDDADPPPPFGRNPMSTSAAAADAEPSRPRPFGSGQQSSVAPRTPTPSDPPTDATDSSLGDEARSVATDADASRPRPFGPGQVSSAAPRAQPAAVSPDASEASEAPPSAVERDAAEAPTTDGASGRVTSEPDDGADERGGRAEAPGPDAPGDLTR